MPSPFPGMDPYLEGPLWPGFHESFITYCREWLVDNLPPGYDADIGERVDLVSGDDDGGGGGRHRVRVPDVSVRELAGVHASSNGNGSAAVLALEPETLPQGRDVAATPVSYVEVKEGDAGRLVTVIELLSPANKARPDLGEYGVKRAEVLDAWLGLVEIDLLLSGHRPRLGREPRRSDYAAFVTRPGRPRQCEVYGWNLADPLPNLPVPLLEGDGQIVLDLPAVFTMTYDRGGYPRRMRYGRPCPAPLEGDAAEWARQTAASPAAASSGAPAPAMSS